MKNIQILDCTLRDGGCVNDFNFGSDYMGKILCALEESGVDMIEMGYIDEKKGSSEGRTQYDREEAIRGYLKEKKPGVAYVAMIDYGKFDADRLPERTETDVDGIRLAFHKKDRKEIVACGKKIMAKGYRFYIQPMTVMRYSDSELLELIGEVNEKLSDASAFYIVDSFGEMRANDMNRILNLVDHNLYPGMTLGFHSHNNLQLSYSNAITFIDFHTERDRIIDVSIMGMGKGAGNLNTELFAEHLNLYFEKSYRIEPLLEVIDTVINQLHSEFYWGYSVEYYLSSIHHCTPSYAGHFFKKHMLSIDQVSELLKLLPEEKKISFDREFADRLYLEYNEKKQKQDEEETLSELKRAFSGKAALLLAPGRRLTEADGKIKELLRDDGVVSVSLNNHKAYETDYVLATKRGSFEGAAASGRTVIVTSNVLNAQEEYPRERIKTLNYKNWIRVENGVNDSAVVVIFGLLSALGVKKAYLAGFDGFSANINENYLDKTLRRPVTDEQARERNEFFRTFLRKQKETMELFYLTESLYNK